LYELQKLEVEWKVHWMSMQELGMSDVEIGHIQMFVVFSDRGECCCYLEWKIKNKMSAYMGPKSTDTHKQIPHHMPSKAGTFSH